MSFAIHAYQRAPVWTQNLLLSAYGVRLRRLRYGQTGKQTLAQLRKSQWMSPTDIAEFQISTLSDVITRAARDVPYYRGLNLRGRRIDSFDQLNDIPILKKSAVQRAGREMISDRYLGARLEEVHTGGTTGTPLAIYCDSTTLQKNYAFFSRFKEGAGLRDGDRVATFAGRPIVPALSKAPYWRRNRAANTLLFSSYHIGPETLQAYADELAAFNPALIDSYPSSIEPIARYVIEHSISTIRPTAIITSSETLFPATRAVIERAFDCKVFDQYGGAEMVAFIGQCTDGTYHVAPEFGFIEVLDEGRPVPAGERGEIVATGFINPVMPLIRYATGDYAVLGSKACPCGRAGQTIESLEGRMDDVLITPEGHRVGRLDPIFKAVSSLHETRIVQDAADHVRVEIVVVGALPGDTELELRNQLRLRLGPQMKIDIVRVPSIERTGRGKLRTTVNLLRGRDGGAPSQGNRGDGRVEPQEMQKRN